MTVMTTMTGGSGGGGYPERHDRTDNHMCYVSLQSHAHSEQRGVSDRPSEALGGPGTTYSACLQEDRAAVTSTAWERTPHYFPALCQPEGVEEPSPDAQTFPAVPELPRP